MADILQDYAASTVALGMTGIATLTNGSSGTSDTLTNTTTKYLDYQIMVGITTNNSATATGMVEIFVQGSVDGAIFENDGNDRWIGTITMAAIGINTRYRLVSIAAAFNGGVPPYCRLRLRNVSGGTLTAASATVIGILAETV
jgi:hypothetical protein